MSTLHPWKTLIYVDGDKNKPVILGKRGNLSATIVFVGRDLRTAPDYNVVNDAALHIGVLAEFAHEEGMFFHYDQTSVPSAYLKSPWFLGGDDGNAVDINDAANGMVKLLAKRRAERHEALVEPAVFVTLSCESQERSMKWIKSLIFGGRKARKANDVVYENIREFDRKVQRFTAIMNERLGNARRLDANRLYGYCYYTLTGLWAELEAPKVSGVSFDYLMRVQRNDDEDGNVFSVRAINQEVHVRAVTMYGMPDEIRPEFFEDMGLLGAGMRWVTRLIIVPPAKVRKEYTDQWIRYKSGMMSFQQALKQRMTGEGEVDPVQEELARAAREDVKGSSNCLFGAHVVSSVIVYRTTSEDADLAASRVAEHITNKKKPCVIEDVGTKLAFAMTVPGCSQYKGSRDLLPDWPVVSMLPCSMPDTGPGNVPWQFTIGNVFPARVDFGNGQNRHVAITAPVRAGKSTLIELMIAGTLAHTKNPFVYLLDVDVNQSASRIACTAMGGKVLSFANGTAAIQPFRHIDEYERRVVAKNWVKQCIRAHGFDDRSPAIDRRIDEAFALLARFHEDERTVLNFKKLVQDRVVKQCMVPFATGDYAAHVGGHHNIIGKPPYVVVDCTGLMRGDAHAACVIAALINEITFTVDKHQGPVQMFIDEAAQVFPFIADSLKSAYKRWPKKGGGITVVIHNPSDLEAIGETGEIITQNTGAWVCLHDPRATENKAYEKHVLLTEFQRALVSEMRQGTFLVKADREARVIQTDLSPLERFILGQGKKAAEELANRLDAVSVNSDDFGVKLLREGGFHEDAEWLEGNARCNVVQFGIAAE